MKHGELSIETFVEDSFGENAYVVSTEGRAWVIDPSFPPQVHQLLHFVSSSKLEVEKIVLTHGHADHIAGVDFVHAAHPRAELWIASEDAIMLTDANANLSGPYGMGFTVQTPPDGDLQPGIKLQLGRFSWTVLDTSGHSPGGRTLYCAEAGVVLAGDALFAGSIGRTDFPGSDHYRLIRSIRENLLKLPDETVVYSGHGPITTIGKERKFNPFLTD